VKFLLHPKHWTCAVVMGAGFRDEWGHTGGMSGGEKNWGHTMRSFSSRSKVWI